MKASEPSAKQMSFEELLAQNGYLVYTNVGTSMMPLLRQRRDIIEIRAMQRKSSELRADSPEQKAISKPSDFHRYSRFDVVLYKLGDIYILHRILKVLPTGYIVAGDHNTYLDPPVTDDMILGLMTRVIRNGKSISQDSIWYRLYVNLWVRPYRLRMLILRALSKIHRITGKQRTKNRSGEHRQ